MKLTERYLRKIIREEMENMGDVVTLEYGGGGYYIAKNDEAVSSVELAEAFGEHAQKLLSIAEENQGGSVDQDAFLEYYLRPKMFKGKGLEEIAQAYAEKVGAEYKESERNEDDY